MYPVTTHYIPSKNDDYLSGSKSDSLTFALQRVSQLENEAQEANNYLVQLQSKWKEKYATVFSRKSYHGSASEHNEEEEVVVEEEYENKRLKLKNEINKAKVACDEAQSLGNLALRNMRKIKKSFDPKPYVLLLQQIDASTPSTERGDLLVFLGGNGFFSF
jgi:hypothetical protein